MPELAVSRRVVRHHGSEDNTLGPDDCKAHALGPVANTDTKLLIYGLFHEGRVLAHNGVLQQRGVSAPYGPGSSQDIGIAQFSSSLECSLIGPDSKHES